MRFCVLGSGSKGNCTYVSSTNTSLLIDAGFSGVEIERRLSAIGVDAASLDAIIVTHEHGDHARGVSILSRRFNLPVFANKLTCEAAGKYLQKLHVYNEFSTGTSFKINNLNLHPFAVLHDTADPVGFTIDDGEFKLGYCTDTGVVSKLICHRLSDCNALVVECNHDLEMLKDGPYPVHVQQRVRSKKGHLANPQTIEFLKELYHEDLVSIVLAHVSQSNNSIDIIEKSVEDLLNGLKEDSSLNDFSLAVSIAKQDEVGELVILKKLK